MVSAGLVIGVLSGQQMFAMALAWLALVPAFGAARMLALHAWDAAAAARTYFAITDVRIIVLNRWTGQSVASFRPSRQLSVERKNWTGDRGTVVISQLSAEGTGPTGFVLRRPRRTRLLTMHGITDLTAAVAALDRLFADSRPG
ncbi:MAG: hypothetical protein RLO51_17720 [Thalassobaculum sp.]|uniref:hypothetical protein n=1 Tax=Thalassobaculum sp. TaxID=2022740 RepID=UPI0032EF734D